MPAAVFSSTSASTLSPVSSTASISDSLSFCVAYDGTVSTVSMIGAPEKATENSRAWPIIIATISSEENEKPRPPGGAAPPSPSAGATAVDAASSALRKSRPLSSGGTTTLMPPRALTVVSSARNDLVV